MVSGGSKLGASGSENCGVTVAAIVTGENAGNAKPAKLRAKPFNAKAGIVRGRKKKVGEPKRPTGAFVFFQKDVRGRFKSENPEASFGELVKLMSAKWRTLMEAGKMKYSNLAAKDKERYRAQMGEYQAMSVSTSLVGGGKRSGDGDVKMNSGMPGDAMGGYVGVMDFTSGEVIVSETVPVESSDVATTGALCRWGRRNDGGRLRQPKRNSRHGGEVG